MSKHIIFAVHGVGDTKPGWSGSVGATLKEQYAKFNVSKVMPFDQHFELCEINYNDKLDKHRARWKQSAAPVVKVLKEAGLGDRAGTAMLQWASDANEEKFLNTHALDVVFYRFLATAAQQIRDAVQKQILDRLAAEGAKDTGILRWSVIGHSLGTPVVHDVIHQMFSRNRPKEWGELPANLFRPQVIMMIANVSRLLENQPFYGPDGDVYRSAARPSAVQSEGGCGYFINVRHEFDPIPMPRLFRPVDDWPDPLTRSQNRYHSVLINAIEQKNVHDFVHYLRNPKTVAPLFRLLTVPGLVTPAEVKILSQQYESSTPLGKFSVEVKNLEAMALAESENDWKAILDMLHNYFHSAN